uniref:UBA domain-containing protein n=1 Tax=Ditylenchus dipsaci TaxID=166011 RepID=A0A915D2U6_9BILA
MNIPSSSSIHRNAQPPNYLIQQHRQQSPNTGGNTTMLYLDGTNSSSRTPPYTTTASSSMEAGTNGQVQHPGHHRDKLDLIRDSLRPFEQLNEQFSPNNTGPTSSMTSSTGSNSEPSEEVQRTMINALIQGGFDREAAYYALKLVNFNSVMDAAKVLSNIKQNLTQQQLHMQHAPTSNHNNRGYGSVSPSNDLGDNLTQQALSSQSRAALSRTHWQAGPSSSQQHYSSNKPVVVTQSLPHQYHHPNYEGSFGSGSSSRSSGSPPIYGSQQPSANIELSAAPRAAQWSNGTNWIDSQQQQKRHLKAAQSIPHTKNYHSIEESDEKTPPPSSSRSTQDHHALQQF